MHRFIDGGKQRVEVGRRRSIQHAAERGREEWRREIGTALSTTHGPHPSVSTYLPPPFCSTKEGTTVVCVCVLEGGETYEYRSYTCSP